MLPKWAFGYVQSKERYATQEELIEVVREYRARRLAARLHRAGLEIVDGRSVGPEDRWTPSASPIPSG